MQRFEPRTSQLVFKKELLEKSKTLKKKHEYDFESF